jgi:hypothetical protein
LLNTAAANFSRNHARTQKSYNDPSERVCVLFSRARAQKASERLMGCHEHKRKLIFGLMRADNEKISVSQPVIMAARAVPFAKNAPRSLAHALSSRTMNECERGRMSERVSEPLFYFPLCALTDIN